MVQRLNTTNPAKNITSATLRTAVEASRSPLILTDNSLPDNPIVYSNQAFLDLTGYKMKDIIGKNCRFLQGEDSDTKTVKALSKYIKAGKSIRVDIKNYRKDGKSFWNDLIISPIKDDSGVITHFMGMQLDITERMEGQEKLAKKTKELESSNQELEQFTYATSHDLQEPLRMVSSYLQLIKKRYRTKLDKDALQYIDFATEGAERMQDLIYDLLTLSRVSSSEDVFKKIKMGTVIERAMHNVRKSIDDTNAKITVDPLPLQCADPVQMTQLFQNLISNAIKYHTPGVTPEIHISVEKFDTEVIYSIADNGIGIDKKYFDRIFIVFQRLHTRSEYAGTGIGLAICSKIVERHKGRIWVESAKGKGATFKVALPIN